MLSVKRLLLSRVLVFRRVNVDVWFFAFVFGCAVSWLWFAFAFRYFVNVELKRLYDRKWHVCSRLD